MSEDNSKALGCLGLAMKAGLLVTGEQNTGASVHGGAAKLIVLASDASENAQRRARGFSASSGVPLVESPMSKAEIAAATGRSGCSMAAFHDAGLALRFCTDIGVEDAVLLQRLAETAERVKKSGKANKIGKRRKSV